LHGEDDSQVDGLQFGNSKTKTLSGIADPSS
jgi:hypothetical protein